MKHQQIAIIAGPNGAGKTTFVKTFLPILLDVPLFVNADMIAQGLAPFNPTSQSILAGKIMHKLINKYVADKVSFSFETTLSGRGYARKIPMWQQLGFSVSIIFLSLKDEYTAIERVAYRVSQGGHDIPTQVIRRRFHKGLENFHSVYKELVDSWFFYDNTGKVPSLIEYGGTIHDPS